MPNSGLPLLSSGRLGRLIRLASLALVLLSLLMVSTGQAASWNNIEPLKSRRADVEKALGAPLAEGAGGEAGALRFKVNGGVVTVSFVTAKFIAAKNLDPELEGTVLQIVLQHDLTSTATPESMNLANDSDYVRENRQNVVLFTNAKKGLIYTFIDGRLRTSWYNPSAELLARSQVRKK